MLLHSPSSGRSVQDAVNPLPLLWDHGCLGSTICVSQQSGEKGVVCKSSLAVRGGCWRNAVLVDPRGRQLEFPGASGRGISWNEGRANHRCDVSVSKPCLGPASLALMVVLSQIQGNAHSLFLGNLSLLPTQPPDPASSPFSYFLLV